MVHVRNINTYTKKVELNDPRAKAIYYFLRFEYF